MIESRIVVSGDGWTVERILDFKRPQKKTLGAIEMFTVDCADGFRSIYTCQTHQIIYLKYTNFILCQLYLNNILRNLSSEIIL